MRGRSGLGLGVLVVMGTLVVPLALFLPRPAPPRDRPREHLPGHPEHRDHAALLKGPYPDGPSVTRACLECHAEAAPEVMRTVHWTWEGAPVAIPGRDAPVAIGKKNVINNFCIGVQSNWPGCTGCHAGYGWKDDTFDFSKAENVDCLVCHDRTGTYAKGQAGLPAGGVDLVAVAGSVGSPTRAACGSCHFSGGGGDAVKHGDLDASLGFPPERVDVHMGRHDMICTDCHRAEHHRIAGRSISVSVDNANQVACTDCHVVLPHGDDRIDMHVATVACQTCHIPEVAIREATKVYWDWSEAGQDRPEGRDYMKKKGSFVYERELRPEYLWYNGIADRHLQGDVIDPARTTPLNPPRGSITDPGARIWPFKVHRGKQIYDTRFLHLLVPKTVGEGGYWAAFDWDQAARLGSEATGLAYSGRYGFAATEMFWPLTHMVAPKENALRCTDCHGEAGLLDWTALGYPGDPMKWGGRDAARSRAVAEAR